MKNHKLSAGKYLFSLTPILCLLVIVCAGFQKHEKTASMETPVTHTVTILKMKFDPEHLTVKSGDKVVWINKDFVPHDITDEVGKKWTSGILQKGQQWTKTITKDTKYFCSLHEVMKGSITVKK